MRKECFYIIRERLDKYSVLLPVLCFAGNIIMMLNILLLHETDLMPDQSHYNIDWLLRHFYDTSGLFIILMIAKSRNYRWFSWLCFGCVCAMWLLNLIYVTFDFPQDIYYTSLVCLIYATFVIFVLGKITNRW